METYQSKLRKYKNMKTNIKLFFAAGLIALTAGCTDLDVTPEAQYTEYPNSEAAVEAQMADVYFHLRGTLGRRYMESQALSSDEWVGISFDGDYADGGIYAQCSLHNFDPTSACIDWYEDVSAGITKANRVIVNMGGEENDATAQARFMRAYYTWILMNCFGDTPILSKLASEGEQIDRAPRAEVARWIESELKAIIDLLPTNVDVSTYGKPTRYAAEALLAKLYINWPVYTASTPGAYDAASYSNEHINDVVTLCDDIIKSGKFSLSEGANGYRSSPTMVRKSRISSMLCLSMLLQHRDSNIAVHVSGVRDVMMVTVDLVTSVQISVTLQVVTSPSRPRCQTALWNWPPTTVRRISSLDRFICSTPLPMPRPVLRISIRDRKSFSTRPSA